MTSPGGDGQALGPAPDAGWWPWVAALLPALGDRLKQGEPLCRYTSARIGGPADYLIAVESAAELAEALRLAWQASAPYLVLGGGSNVLAADAGFAGLVILNRARAIEFREQSVRAESGASLGALARQCAGRGWAGLEWAVNVPGTVGGAVFGNAGAHGGDIAGSLLVAEILQRDGVRRWLSAAELGFEYRSSALKRAAAAGQTSGAVLAAEFRLTPGDPSELQTRLEEFVAYRKRTQPPGASLGSMFKNPPGDYAGRLIEAAGLKGRRIGQAEISELHGNFFVNLGAARASEVKALIDLARDTVKAKFGVELELEIELVGEWRGGGGERERGSGGERVRG